MPLYLLYEFNKYDYVEYLLGVKCTMNISIRKSNIKIGSSIGPLYQDIFSIVFIFLMNPILYFITLSPGIFPPDLFAYLTFAKNLFNTGLLYLPSWGHIDTGLILPPIYPFLIAVGRFFSSETLNVAEYINSICMLLFCIPAFLLIKQLANRVIAVIALILIQVNYYFFLVGMRPLTEAVFLLTIGFTLWLSLLVINSCHKKQHVLLFFLGLSCSLVFLSRQIGVVIYLFIGLLFLFQWFIQSKNSRRTILNKYLIVAFGSLVILVPYSIVLYWQTGQHPLKQHFRKNEYVVKVDDSRIIEKIEQAKDLPDNLVKLIEGQPDYEYGIIYAQRRRMRELLPDASEMYSNVHFEGKEQSGSLKKALLGLLNPRVYFKKIWNNILNLQVSLGSFGTILFFILCFAPLFLKTDKKRSLERFLLPSFIIIYLLAISVLTDKIARYAYILFPFCLMHISIEMDILFNKLKRIPKFKLPSFLMIFFIFTSVLATTPRFFTDLSLSPKYLGIDNEYGYDFKKIVNGEPVFSLFPYEAYIIGSPYHILPNDSLEKVAAYGKKTGVRWILLFHSTSSISELQMYENLKWYSSRALEKIYPDLVKFRLGRKDESLMLYEIL